MGFKIRTLSEGIYNAKIFFVGSTVRGEFSGLTIIVSDKSIEAMHCVDADHKHRDLCGQDQVISCGVSLHEALHMVAIRSWPIVPKAA